MLCELLYHLVIMRIAVFSPGTSGFSLLFLFSKVTTFTARFPHPGHKYYSIKRFKTCKFSLTASQFPSKYPPYQLSEVKEEVP